MSKTITVAAKDLPPVLSVLLHKEHVEVTLCDSVEIGSMQWDGGTRYQYAIVELATGHVKPIVDVRPWPQNMNPIGRVEIPSGFVVVQTGTFCGKPSSGHVYANVADVTAALPKLTPELPHHLQQTLKAIATYNSKGKERHRQDAGISRLDWDWFVQELVKLGLCNKNGSLTVEGKNVARNIDSLIINPYSDKFKG